MTCERIQDQLQAYVDSDLNPRQMRRMERHIARCPRCQSEVARLRLVVEAVETWPSIEAPASLTQNVMAQISPCPLVAPFRLRVSDFAISVVVSGVVFVLLRMGIVFFRLELLRFVHIDLPLLLQRARMHLLLWGQHAVFGLAPIVWLALGVGGLGFIGIFMWWMGRRQDRILEMGSY